MVDTAYVPPNGARPDYRALWGTDDLDFLSRYDGLLLFRLNPLGAYCLGTAETDTPPAQEERLLLEVRPNREIALLHPPLPPADVLTLEAFTEPSDQAFRQLDPAKILAAVESGRPVSELETSLQVRGGPLPPAVQTFLADLAALAAELAGNRRLAKLCQRAGDRHLVVPAASETAFRKALRELGYTLPPARFRPRLNRLTLLSAPPTP